MNKQKAMLDALMGASRNKSSKEKTNDDFKDEQFCKYFLVGYCPDEVMHKQIEKEKVRDHFAFCNRPHLPMPCKKMHSVPMRELMEKHPKSTQYIKEYEGLLLKRLEDIEKDVDKFIAIEKRKCKPKEDIVRLSEAHGAEIEEWKEHHAEQLREAKEKGDRGDIEGAQKAMEEATVAKAFIDQRLEKGTIKFPGEECCTVCGGRYLIGIEPESEEDKRGLSGYVWREGHVQRKLHIQYAEARDRLVKLREKLKSQPDDSKERKDDGGAEEPASRRPRQASHSRDEGRGRRDAAPRRRDDSRGREPPPKRRDDSRGRRSHSRRGKRNGRGGGRADNVRSRSGRRTSRGDSRDMSRGRGGNDRRR